MFEMTQTANVFFPKTTCNSFISNFNFPQQSYTKFHQVHK